MKMEMTPEEHARLHRRRGRQALGLLIAVLVLIGTLTVLHAGVSAVAKLFDDTAQRQEYEDKLEGLVLFDPVPFDGIENIDDLTLREAAVWGCVYSIQETQGGFEGYNTDPDTEQLLIPSVDVDAYLAKLVGPSFRMTHKTFEMEDMTIEFDDATQCYKIPITGGVGSYRATVTKLFKKGGLLHVTVGYIPTQNADDSILAPVLVSEDGVELAHHAIGHHEALGQQQFHGSAHAFKDAWQAIGKLLALSHKQVTPQRFIQARHLEFGYAIGIDRRYFHVQCVLHGLAAMAAVRTT